MSEAAGRCRCRTRPRPDAAAVAGGPHAGRRGVLLRIDVPGRAGRGRGGRRRPVPRRALLDRGDRPRADRAAPPVVSQASSATACSPARRSSRATCCRPSVSSTPPPRPRRSSPTCSSCSCRSSGSSPLGRRLHRITLVSLAIAVAGLALLTGGGDASFGIGELLTLGCAVCFAAPHRRARRGRAPPRPGAPHDASRSLTVGIGCGVAGLRDRRLRLPRQRPRRRPRSPGSSPPPSRSC